MDSLSDRLRNERGLQNCKFVTNSSHANLVMDNFSVHGVYDSSDSSASECKLQQSKRGDGGRLGIVRRGGTTPAPAASMRFCIVLS